MYVINNNLFSQNSFHFFINDTISRLEVLLKSNDISLYEQKEYWLFYFIIEDFRANLYSLQATNIDVDCLGFPLIRKNTRHAIEALIDLFNLCHDSGYIEVLLHNDKKKMYSTGKYARYIYSGTRNFTIQSKARIARDFFDRDFQSYVDICKESNAFIHPTVFIDIVEKEDKIDILSKLLRANARILDEAFKLILKKYNQGNFLCMCCATCQSGSANCKDCYTYLFNYFMANNKKESIVKEYPNIHIQYGI